jgi:alkyl hydroperoxide reductase subunit AhpC
MLPADAGTTSEGRTAANNATVRTVFVIGPDKKINTFFKMWNQQNQALTV